LFLCEQVRWDLVSHRMGNADLFTGRLVGNMKWFQAGYPEGEFNTTSYNTYTVAGPVGPEAVGAAVPEDFLSEESESLQALCVSHFENGTQSACYHDNYYS